MEMLMTARRNALGVTMGHAAGRSRETVGLTHATSAWCLVSVPYASMLWTIRAAFKANSGYVPITDGIEQLASGS